MLSIVNGNVNKVKEELKLARKRAVEDKKEVKKQIKGWLDREKRAAKEEKRKEEPYPKEYDKKLTRLEELEKFYSSGIVPVAVGSIMIDFATYQKVVGKLKDFQINIAIAGTDLIMRYNRRNAKGVVHLHDLTPYFKDFQYVPKAVIGNGQET